MLQLLLLEEVDTTDGVGGDFFAPPEYTARDFGEDIINLGNDLDASTAVLVYGIVAGVQAIIPLIVVLLLSTRLPTYLSAEFFTYIF